MSQTPPILGSSAIAERMLRSAALWASDCAGMALAVFEDKERGDNRPRDAINGAREFGFGGRRDKALRTLAWAAHAAAKECGQQSAKYAARSAMLAAAVAYTHTDISLGRQGVRQGRHLLGPAVYAALACEIASAKRDGFAEKILQSSAKTAPRDISILLDHFPPQPTGTTRLSQLFHDLDTMLRVVSAG
jgi:hypothetical protein